MHGFRVAWPPARGLVPPLSVVLAALLLLFADGVHAQDGTVDTDKTALEALYDGTAMPAAALTVGQREAAPKITVVEHVSGLSIPWDLAFAPDGTMLFTERVGRLKRRLANGTVGSVTADFSDLYVQGEAGLMAIVVDPGFASNRRFYTCQAHTGRTVQVIAWTIDAAYASATRVSDPLVGDIPAAGRHSGCRLRFGSLGYLWVATGDAATGTVPQDLASLGGKVLRVDAATGATAPGNPFASRVYSYGHRNVQGLALRPGTSEMWSVEHGPDVDDEINVLSSGGNYGWDPVPTESTDPSYNENVPMTDLVKYPDAIEARWSSGDPTLATSGGIFLEGADWEAWEGRLAVAALKARSLRILEFAADGTFVSQMVVPELDGHWGRLRTPMLGPNGALYVTTSNGGSQDRILKIVPNPFAVESIVSNISHPTKDVFTVTITFSEPATGVEESEIEVDNGTGSNFSGSGATYSLQVTPDSDFEGDVTVTVPAGVAEDGSMNTNEAVSETFAVDTLAPALAATDGATVNGALLTLTFDEALGAANIAASAFTVTGATTRSISSVSVTGSTVELTLNVPVLHGESGIEVDYDLPSREPIVDAVGNQAASFEDRSVTNNTPATTLSTAVRLTMNEAQVAEAGPAKTVTVTGTLNRAARPSATTVMIEVGAGTDTATEGTDYTAVDDLTLTIPAYFTSGTASFTLTPTNDRVDEVGESLTVSGSTTVAGLTVTPPGGLALDIEDNDAAPSLALSVNASTIDENGGTVTVTVSTGSGSTFATDQTVQLSVAGTATETADYTISGKTLTLPAGMGTSASRVTATVTGVDDSLDDDDEAIEITGSRNGVAFGSRQTIAIDDDDWPELTVTFRQADYRVAEGGRVDLPVTLSAVPERQVTIPIEIETVGDTEAIDYAVSPASLTFGASETDKTLQVSAANDSVVDPGESVVLSFGSSLPERITAGGIAEMSVAIRDTDFTFVPAFAVGAGTTESATGIYTVSEASSALRLTLSLETPRGVRVEDIVDPVVVTLSTRENAGTQGTDEDYAAQRRVGTFGDYDALNQDVSFTPTDFSDDATCGCALADKSVSVDLFDDRIHEPDEVFGLRVSRRTGRLSVASQDVTVRIEEDDAEPVLVLETDPAAIVEAGGTSTVTVHTGSGSTFPTAQTIDLAISGTATEDTDFEIDAKRLTLPAGTGTDASSVTTTVRALDDTVDDDDETVIISATRNGAEFDNRTLTIIDDETGSTRVDLSVNPAQVREDAGVTTVRVTASLDADARAQDTEVTVTVGSVGDSAVEGTDYATVADLRLTIDSGETSAETTFSLDPTNDDSVDGPTTITVDGSVSGLAVRSATLTLNDDDVASTEVALTLDPLEVSENAGSRAVRVTGTLNGGARTTETVVTVTVGSGADSALEGTDYAEVPELELTIPANRTAGTVSFTLRPTNDVTAEGEEAISVRGNVTGLTVTSAELILADDDTPSTRLDLSLNPSTVSEAAVPTQVVVRASLNAGARTTDSVVTVTVGSFTDSATEGVDYANVAALDITVLANEATGQTTFTLSPENDAIAEGAESVSVTGQVSGLTVEPATLTLADNDTASRTVALSVHPDRVSEDTPEEVTVTASLNAGARSGDTEIRLTVGAAGDTAVPGTDYERVWTTSRLPPQTPSTRPTARCCGARTAVPGTSETEPKTPSGCATSELRPPLRRSPSGSPGAEGERCEPPAAVRPVIVRPRTPSGTPRTPPPQLT